ncbi:hypothetical protein, partial [Streptomyces sp. NPDC006996]|uniref:hypothetical protein n=1 Tax=Streptomyces sp. NPDC006996 TaxID=3156908 RepID=UPI0033CEC5DA
RAHERSTRGNAVASRGRTSAKNGYTTSRDAISTRVQFGHEPFRLEVAGDGRLGSQPHAA